MAPVPMKTVKFEFPTKFEDTSPAGDELWDSMMPVPETALASFELPVHDNMGSFQAVLRDVIIKYEKRDKSRFAGDGHEYHCLDYVRQAILCAGDTTLDYADDRVVDSDGKVTRYGFTGANSTHQCRDWDIIKKFTEEHKAGDRSGIL
ncbi:hypothetical protein OQA88_7885 [Cercophora sp. LCS_1]